MTWPTSRRWLSFLRQVAQITLRAMRNFVGRISKGGVRIADDFRDNLIIDRHDPAFVSMRAKKLDHLCSENSEDAVTWNVFRSLRQIDPKVWLRELAQRGLPQGAVLPPAGASVSLWVSVFPPISLLVDGEEHASEIDVVLEAPTWVWFIEAKFRSDISMRTTKRELRDQVLRNLDVGSYYAGVRDFYFSLLIADAKRSARGAKAVARYADLSEPRRLLAKHRPDGLANLKSVTLLRWSDLGAVLNVAAASARPQDERGYAERALTWLREKGLLESAA
jgi:hypothetical protein